MIISHSFKLFDDIFKIILNIEYLMQNLINQVIQTIFFHDL